MLLMKTRQAGLRLSLIHIYDLTSLQRDANRVLGFTAQQTLDYTQSLYAVSYTHLMNTGRTEQELENNVFQAQSIAQKHNCNLRRLDSQQEQGLMSSLPLAHNLIEIRRGLTTSSCLLYTSHWQHGFPYLSWWL